MPAQPTLATAMTLSALFVVGKSPRGAHVRPDSRRPCIAAIIWSDVTALAIKRGIQMDEFPELPYIDLRENVAEESDVFAKRLFASEEMTTAIVSIVKVVRTNARADKRAADEMQATDTFVICSAQVLSRSSDGSTGSISPSPFAAVSRSAGRAQPSAAQLQPWSRRSRLLQPRR